MRIRSNSQRAETPVLTLVNMAKRLKFDPDKDKDKILEAMRKKSRNEYLKGRASKQLEIYEEDIKDEKNLFENVNLTKREKERLEYQERVLKLTKSHMHAGETTQRTDCKVPAERAAGRVAGASSHAVRLRLGPCPVAGRYTPEK